MGKATREDTLKKSDYFESILQLRARGQTPPQIAEAHGMKDPTAVNEHCMKALLLVQTGDIALREKTCNVSREESKFSKIYRYIINAEKLAERKDSALLQQQKENAKHICSPVNKDYLEKLLLQRAQGDKFVKLELDFQKAGMVIGRDSTEALILASLGIINMPNIEWDGGNSEFGQYYQIIQKKLSINTLAA